MHVLLFLNTILSIFICTRGQTLLDPSTPFKQSAILDPNDKVELRWKNNETYIVFELKVQTRGWMGMGFSHSGSMAGGDIAVMWVNSGDTVLMDMYSVQNGLPMEDISQDLNLISSEVIDQATAVTFGRKLLACDEDDNDITEDTMRVIYAYGTSVPSSGKLDYPDKHLSTNRGSKSIRLLGNKVLPEPQDEGLTVMEITNDNVEIPAQATYYHCKIHKLDMGQRKNHVVKWEPIIQPGHELYYHHVLVYLCIGFNSSEHANAHGEECYTPNMPGEFRSCRTLVFAWAIGGTKLIFPDDVGFPLDDSKEPIFVMTENHYDNPLKLPGMKDSSGVRIFYTSELRSIDAGIMEVGQKTSPLHFIPAGQTRWTTFSECDGKCIADSFPEGVESFKIFALLLHAHLYGVQLKLRHFRNGVELKPLSADKYYDFNYQEYNMLESEIEFKKGDSFAMECVYDTSHSDVPIFGGIGTDEEMCVAFVEYYPRTDTFACFSTTDKAALSSILGVESNSDEEGFKEVVSNLTGDQSSLNQQILDAPYHVWCNHDIVYNPKNHSLYTPYKEKDPDCSSAKSTSISITVVVIAIIAVCLKTVT